MNKKHDQQVFEGILWMTEIDQLRNECYYNKFIQVRFFVLNLQLMLWHDIENRVLLETDFPLDINS